MLAPERRELIGETRGFFGARIVGQVRFRFGHRGFGPGDIGFELDDLVLELLQLDGVDLLPGIALNDGI